MNEVYALEPSIDIDLRGLRFLFDKFGFSEGRFLAELPSTWKKKFVEKFDGLDRTRAESLLSRRVFLPIDFFYDPSLGWRENARRAYTEARPTIASAIVIDGGESGFIGANSLLDDPEIVLPDSRGAHIERNVPSYLNAINPLVRTSSEIFLVDRFFTCWNGSQEKRRQTNFLVGLLKLAFKHRLCERIEIINGRDQCLVNRDEDDWVEFLKKTYKESGVTDIEFEYSFIEEKLASVTNEPQSGSGLVHPRYIFSRFAGIQFDWGFDVDSRGGTKNHVHWMSDSELKPLIDQFCAA